MGVAGLIFEFLIKALEFTPLSVVDKMEVMELLSENADFVVQFNSLSTDEDQFALKLSEFFDKPLELVSQLSGLVLVLGNDLDQVLDLSLVELSLALELIDSVAEDVALGKGDLVDLDKHLKLLEIEQKGLVLRL
jgi:hypothetical protein